MRHRARRLHLLLHPARRLRSAHRPGLVVLHRSPGPALAAATDAVATASLPVTATPALPSADGAGAAALAAATGALAAALAARWDVL